MNTSKEDLIELAEFKSPSREKSKKTNKVALSNSVTSLCTAASDEENIVNIFSVTPRKQSKANISGNTKATTSERQTVSEISYEVLVVRAETAWHGSNKTDPRKTYKEKITEHIKRIKEKASTPSTSAGQRTGRGKLPVERVRKESDNLDVEVQNVRNKFKLNGITDERRDFFNFIEESQKIEGTDGELEDGTDKKNVSYAIPEKMDYNIASSEMECLFIPDRKSLEIAKKVGNVAPEEDHMSTGFRKIRTSDKNVLEKRLLLEDDRKWFDTTGNLLLMPNPVTAVSSKPNFKSPDRYITSYRPAITKEECNEIVIIENKILNLYLSQLKFTHHPLYSAEHVFAEKLKSLVERHRNEEKTAYKLKLQLEDLRTRRKRDGHGDSDRKIDREIKKVRGKYFDESGKQRNDLRCVLETWRAVKAIRELQKYSNTTVKLVIKKEKVDSDEENEAKTKMPAESMEELVREKGERETSSSRESERENSEMEGGDNNRNADEDNLRKELGEKLEKIFKPPGEPILKFNLSEDNELSEDVDNPKETTRRNAASSTKFYLRILCKDIEACKTKFLGLNGDFALEIDETFSLQLSDVPKFLTVEIFEQPKSLLKKKVCELIIDIPGAKYSRKLQTMDFEKKEIVHYKHTGVGSGIELKTLAEKINVSLANVGNCELRTSGYLEYSIEWEKSAKKKDDNVLPKRIDLLNEIIDKNCSVNSGKLREFLENANPEENISSNDFVLNKDTECFRLNPHQKSLNFCNINEVEQNVRLKILWLRNQKEIEFDGIPVPNRIKEIPFSILSDYKRRKAIEEKAHSFEEDEEDVEAQRNFGRKYLRRIYLLLFQLCKNTENNLDYESVVNEKYLVHFNLMIRTILRNFLNWFRWQPKITKPLPVLGKKSEDETKRKTSKTKSNVNILLKIMCAKNIPNRTNTTFNGDESDENEVRPFVRITYKNLTARTSTNKGENPAWDEILTIPLESANTDYLNPNSLDGNIVVDLFDESDVEIKKLNKKRVIWLGGLDIPISAICYSDSMNGYFRVKLPHILVGYETEEEKQKTKSPKVNSLQSCHHTYLQMEISVQPQIPKLNPNMEELPCGEVPYIREHILKWSASFNGAYPDKRFRALALDSNGRTACVTRFIRALEPPQINAEGFDVSAEQCLRYVSLIPFTDCNNFYDCVWLSTDQLINLMLGSVTDHAIALTCYLIALKMEVWLLLGYAIPHGTTAYVLVRETNVNTGITSHHILDVVHNKKHNLNDEFCPLQKIFCIINSDNVWGNIQRSDVILTRFDLSKRSDWLPLFNDDLPAPTNFISNKVTYRVKQDIEMLEMHLERQLKRQISKLRQLDRTIWNTGLSSVLANMLKSFETNAMYNKNHFESSMELANEISPYTVNGFAFNSSFTSISSLVKKIKSLGIHIQQESDTEFAIAVHFQLYPGLLLSLWVFVTRNRHSVIRTSDFLKMAYTGDASIDFVSQFHNLEGSRIGERKKNFFKLLRDPKWSNEQQLGNVLQNLQPKTYLENLFWVDALIHFKRTPELLEILKQGNEVFISKILKAGWFFEGAFKDMDAEVLVNEFLPCTSFAVRMKLLKRICRYWNGERIDALFDSLEKRYGIFVSSTIFHTCSAPKIKEVLRENDIKLRSNQVKHLFDRDAELFTIYLDHINLLNTTATGTKAYGEAKVLNHIALRNPKLLLELEKSKKINFRRVMGRRTSKKIVKLVEEDILKDPKRYTSILNNVMIVRQLGSKFEIIYRQLFPQKISGISMNNLCNELLVLCPKSRRWDLFAKTYSKVFPTKNIEHLFLNMDDSFLKLNPTKRIVSRWSEKNYYAELSNFDDFLKYFKTSKAIPILKKKINFTSDLCKRASLVILLLENCAQHKDLDALEGVLNYVYSRHRNDDRLFRCQFYDKLNQLFNLDDLNENHWKHIHDLISFDVIKATYSFLTEPLLHKYLEYLLNREDSEESLREYMKDCCEFNVLFNVGIGKPLVERRIMLKMCELFPDLMEGETERFQKGVQLLIENLANFSIANVEYCVILSDFPYLVSFIKDLFSKDKKFDHGISCLLGKVMRYQIHFPQYAIIEKSRIFELILHAVKHKGCAWPYTEILKGWICWKDRSDFNEVSALYLKELFEVSPENDIIIWLLKNEPESLVPYFEKILQKIPLNRSKGFIKELKLYSHFDFDSKAADFYEKQLDQKKCEKNREILKILVELLSTNQFVASCTILALSLLFLSLSTSSVLILRRLNFCSKISRDLSTSLISAP
ncbi:hypothetical protein JTB14_012317 [Gonioctena quinquepunctata]|nr:hypothetical protein JTB14_012317 [Gonioctena quinquepunctata]